MALHTAAYHVAHRLARRRSAPALHPQGLTCGGTLEVPGSPDRRWGAGWLDRPGSYEVTVRWSRALGLPGRLPDGLGLALRVPDAGGPGAALDLLLTSSRPGRLGRHLPLLRRDALAGPYSSLLSYRAGDRERVVAAFPVRGAHGRVPGGLPALRQALEREPVRFHLCTAAADEPWRAVATLTIGPPGPAPEHSTVSYDPYVHRLPDFHPTARLSRLRAAAYSGSRRGRAAPDPDGDGGVTGEPGRDQQATP
ncbi:phosphodiesterase [Streptomyces sp. NPDC006368]|uniref:phosphodiesterase n=1 Tax=Streptomyces sp. NPDC006368 TaxID=3156760 RepID=UPI0033B10957